MEVTHGTLTDLVYRGQPGRFDQKLGWHRHGTITWEWIEPLAGPTVYEEFLKEHGEGFHHFAFDVPDMDAASAAWEARGGRSSSPAGGERRASPARGASPTPRPTRSGGVTIELLWNRGGDRGWRAPSGGSFASGWRPHGAADALGRRSRSGSTARDRRARWPACRSSASCGAVALPFSGAAAPRARASGPRPARRGRLLVDLARTAERPRLAEGRRADPHGRASRRRRDRARPPRLRLPDGDGLRRALGEPRVRLSTAGRASTSSSPTGAPRSSRTRS